MPTNTKCRSDLEGTRVVLIVETEGELKKQEAGEVSLSLLTGMMGAGKSTLGQLLVTSGDVVLIDADIVAKETVYVRRLQENISVLTEIFGWGIFTHDSKGHVSSVKLDRVKELFFDNPQIQAKFSIAFDDQILKAIHSAILVAYGKEGCKHIIVENAVAIEKCWHNKLSWNHIICVVCSTENQILRLRKRSGMTEANYRARIQAQFSSEKKMTYADIVVIANGKVEDLCICAEYIHEYLGRV